MGRRHIAPVSDVSVAASRSHRRRRAAWSSGRRANDRWRQFQPPFCARRIGVDLRDRAIDQNIFEVRRVGHGMEKPLPYAVVGPAAEACMDRRPLAKHLRQIAPMRRVARHPQNGIDEQPVVNAAPTRRPDPSRKMPFDPTPLLVRQCSSAQRSSPSTTLNQNSSEKGSL